MSWELQYQRDSQVKFLRNMCMQVQMIDLDDTSLRYRNLRLYSVDIYHRIYTWLYMLHVHLHTVFYIFLARSGFWMGEDTTMRKIVIQTAATSIPLFIPLIVQNIVMDSDSLDKDQVYLHCYLVQCTCNYLVSVNHWTLTSINTVDDYIFLDNKQPCKGNINNFIWCRDNIFSNSNWNFSQLSILMYFLFNIIYMTLNKNSHIRQSPSIYSVQIEMIVEINISESYPKYLLWLNFNYLLTLYLKMHLKTDNNFDIFE